MIELCVPQYTVRPASGDPPGIVVIHDGNGIGDALLRFAIRLAAEGYAVSCPDLYFRTGGTGAMPVDRHMAALDREQVRDELVGSAESLRSAGAPSVGVTGFCLGGSLSYRMAVDTDAFDAALGFYGSSATRALGDPRCPLLMFYGGNDPYVPQEDLDRVVARHPDTIVYPDAGHGFMRDFTDEYHEAAATDAWDRMLVFFAEHLTRSTGS